MAEFISHRRFFLSKCIAARETGELALSDLWQGKQLSEPGGTPLPDGFPEDLVGADEQELGEWVHLSGPQAQAVLAAAAAL